MKVTDLLPDAGRPIAYFPSLRRIAGSTNAALLLCQLIYWHGKQRDPSGWITKRIRAAESLGSGPQPFDDQSLEAETGLTFAELRAARQQLRERGLIHERHDRASHTTHFRVNLPGLREACEHDNPARRRSVQASAEVPPSLRGGALKPPLNGNYIDYTETTAEKASSPSSSKLNLIDDVPSTPLEALQHPLILLFQDISGRIPGVRDYALVIDLMRHFQKAHGESTADFLRPFWLAWSSRRRSSDGKPYDPGSLTWLSEWAMNGHIPPTHGGSNATSQTKPATRRPLTPEDARTAELINRRRRGRSKLSTMSRDRISAEGPADRTS